MTKDMKGKVSNTSLGVLWLTIVIVGNLTGVLIEVWSGVEPKKIIKDMNIRDFTGPT